ncbi:head-tail connector protein [Pelagibacter phage HTVC010P]|uniref:head-tail adaptor n=1 Tax=Pelagibacter phage HTVC010P TaxID=1283077 RepID=UPI0002B282D7|nr:head-tail adaptor [Pelagibacter phage HTVC010P]AGE60275.1 head-tail connector protein [Pelagibacter phage HTVC010P]
MARTDLTKGLLSRYEKLEGQRQNWETHWQEVADYMQPRKADVTKQRARGDKRMEQVFDSSPIQAVELLAASLHGMLTNPSTPWFTLRFKDEEIENEDEAKLWLEASTDAMYTAFNRSNFQQEIFELYHDLITFGTAAMFIEEDDEDIIKFSTRHINEVFIAENDKGRIDTIYRRFKISARAAMQKFGEAVSSDVQSAFKKDPYKEVEILHAVYPRTDFNPNKKDKKNMPFESVYIEFKNGNELSVSGFREFPFVVPRYLKASNEIYGRSPAMTALPDVKMLNEMCKTTIKAAQKQVDPPLLVPDDGFLLPVRTVPGGLNFYRSGTRDRIEPLNIGANNPLGLNMEQQRRDSIRAVFYVNQLMMQDGPQMTATEVIQRNEEKMRLLGPVLGRLQSELLKPLIDRVFAILLRNNMLPAAPEFLSGRDVEIEYVSPLAKAQKSTELQSIMRAVEILGSLANVAPVFDYVNFDNLVKHLADIVGVPQKILKTQSQVNAERQQAQQQQQEMQQMQQLQQVAKAGGDIAPLAKALPEEARAVANAEVE